MEILLRELYWQQMMAEANTQNTTVSAQSRSIPTDPLLGSQWHLINSGQQVGNPDYQAIYGVAGEDINVAQAWNLGYTGAGVTVAVIDSGIQLNHPDLAANINTALGYDFLRGVAGGDVQASEVLVDPVNGPIIFNPGNAHGTAVAGLIGAVANNGIGGTGVAPGVSMVPIRLIDDSVLTPGQLDLATANAFRYHIQDIDITNNSWGPADIRVLGGPSAGILLALRDSILFGRGGLGQIHVWASGNGAGSGAPEGFDGMGFLDSAGYDGYANSRYTIAVTGVDHDGFYNNVDGTVTSYMEAGTNVLVAAPTGSNGIGNDIANDTGLGSGLWTTDLTGTLESGKGGFNISPNPTTGQEYDRDFLTDTGYTSRFNGTSAAAPIVSGVIALMLEANPNLSWRDVQEILVRSARQNAQYGEAANGAGQGNGIGAPNTWIQNQTPLYHAADPWLGDIALGQLGTRNPFYDPMYDPPQTYTNGAGYTVSLGTGWYGEQIGYGHGVVDATMAVQMAEQWHTKGQNLPSELTYTSFFTGLGLNLPAAELGSEDSGFILVPGGLGGQPGFIDFYNEFYVDDPFSDAPFPVDTRGIGYLPISVPENNAMTIESIDIKLSIDGPVGDVMDNLRVVLVSPEGTHSELNDYFVEVFDPRQDYQNVSLGTVEGDGMSSLNTGASFVWTFNTNRSWGERSSDALIIDAMTNEPSDGGFLGGLLERGWQLHFENWGSTDFVLRGAEIAFHGSPIAEGTQRVQGFVGVDNNRDDLFNYDRVTTIVDQQSPDAFRYGDVRNVLDEQQESFAGNVTVVARRASDGVVVDRFVTGHDGNYYFDLVPDDYIISVEDPLGRVAQDDSLTAAGLLSHYKSEWLVTSDFFTVWDHDGPNPDEVLVDANGVPIVLAGFEGTATSVKNINFLLDPGAPALPQVEFAGTVYADTNGDGVFNGTDVVLPNISVYGDVNRNGQLDSGESIVQTDANGQYNLIVPKTAVGVVNVGVVLPRQWTATSPDAGVHSRFVAPGDEFSGLDFYIKPSADTIVGSGSLPGILLGSVFQDLDADGVRDTGELGAPGFTIYIDANNNNVLDFGDTQTTSNQFGAYAFTNVAPGQRIVRIIAPSPFQTTTPTAGRFTVNLTGNGTISNLVYGLKDTAILDYGDLPAIYGATTLAQNGARHKKGVYFLGNRVDGELNGNPTANADGDDVTGFDDDDGIVFDPIVPGSTVRLIATASRNNGYLKGWIDWNSDGDFDDANERLVFSGIGNETNNVLLSAGANQLFINVPAGVNVANVYARFRYGEQTINSIFGEALTGEVEDYLLAVAPPAIPAIVGLPADSTGDGRVDGADFLNWQRNFGKSTGATQSQGSTNGDGDVDGYDLVEWKGSYGQSVAVAALTTEEDDVETPQSLAAEFQTISTFTAAAEQSLSANLKSTGATLSLNTVSPAVVDEATDRFESRPIWSAIAGRLTDVADRLRQRADSLGDKLDEGRDFVVELLEDVADRVDNFDFESVRRDRAFDDLFGSRRRQGFKIEAEAEAGEENEADEAFAIFADHFEVPRG